MAMLPSPPMPISASRPSRRTPSITSSERSFRVPSGIGKAKGSPRLVVPRMVPAMRAMAGVALPQVERGELHRTAQQALGALVDAEHAPAIAEHGARDDGADHGVEPGAVAAAGQHADGLR